MSDTMRSAAELAMPMGDGQAVARAVQTWLSATSQYHREMMEFMSRRLEKDGVAMRDILGCRNFADAVTLHSHWMEETLRDYNAEMSKLMTIYSHSVNGGEQGSGR
ncbi:phasin family protein [Microvirga sp. TS319]|uniref:phasin family protein n=1 Tax=Microvirga sp. TS319 TaxID=3241165 RepID=UPI00351A7C40